MRLPLRVRWSHGAVLREAVTESTNVSSRGIHFFLPKSVRHGLPIEITMTLPHEITLAGPVRVRCLGSVRRTESQGSGKVGVVAAIEHYEFLRGDHSAA